MKAACTMPRYDPSEPADHLARAGADSFHLLSYRTDDKGFPLLSHPKSQKSPLTPADLLMRKRRTNLRGSYHGEKLPTADMPLVFHIDFAITCALRNGGVLDVDRAFPCGVPQSYQLCKNLYRSYFLTALWRMMLRKVPMRDCARMLNTPLSTCYRWRQEVFNGILRSFEGLPYHAPDIQLRARQMLNQ